MSDISALQDLQQLHISVYDSLGSIGTLRSLTSLDANFNDPDRIELDLQNPELQYLDLTATTNINGLDQVCAYSATICINFPALQDGHHCLSCQQHRLVIPGSAACLQDEQKWRCLSALSSLRSLHLYNFRLADLPAEVALLTKLTSLSIDNGLGSMSRDLSLLENLVELRLSCEYLSSLLAMLSTCRSLEQLILTE